MKAVIGDHKHRAHALLSASSATRWINCPPSARLEESFPNKTSVFAEEGTLAHEFCQLGLEVMSDNISAKDYYAKIEIFKTKPLFKSEMLECAEGYCDSVWSKFMEIQKETPDAELLIEEKVDFSEIVPEGFGSCDSLIIGEGILYVCDYKHGMGVAVSAEKNPQLMLYALGAYLKYDMMYGISKVILKVYQPRVNNFSEYEMPATELLDFANNIVKPAAEKAFKGGGVCASGSWCRFCKCKAKCRAFSEKNLELAQYEFKDSRLLSDEEVSEVLITSEMLSTWVKSIHAYAREIALSGREVKGFKLVEAKTNRTYTDVVELSKRLKLNDYYDDDIFDTKLKPITKIEKLVGKKIFKSEYSDFYEKPKGEPTLVRVSDKRKPMVIGNEFDDGVKF